jgi:hypothetical protein
MAKTPSPIELLKSVSLADVENRLAEIRAEESSLEVLARSLRAKEASRERAERRQQSRSGAAQHGDGDAARLPPVGFQAPQEAASCSK